MARPLPPTPPPVVPPPVAPPSPDRTTLPVVPTAPSPTLDPAPLGQAFQLPPHQTKVERIGDHVAALSADLREWTELRIALVQRKIEGIVGIVDRIKHLVPALELAIPGVILVLIGLLFALVTLAIGVGVLLGHMGWGFLVVTSLLLVVGGLLIWLGYRRYKEAEAIVAQAKRERKSSDVATREEVQSAQSANVRRSTA